MSEVQLKLKKLGDQMAIKVKKIMQEEMKRTGSKYIVTYLSSSDSDSDSSGPPIKKQFNNLRDIAKDINRSLPQVHGILNGSIKKYRDRIKIEKNF